MMSGKVHGENLRRVAAMGQAPAGSDELLEVWKADCRRAYLERDDVAFEALLSKHETRMRELASGVDSVLMAGADDLKRQIRDSSEKLEKIRLLAVDFDTDFAISILWKIEEIVDPG